MTTQRGRQPSGTAIDRANCRCSPLLSAAFFAELALPLVQRSPLYERHGSIFLLAFLLLVLLPVRAYLMRDRSKKRDANQLELLLPFAGEKVVPSKGTIVDPRFVDLAGVG